MDGRDPNFPWSRNFTTQKVWIRQSGRDQERLLSGKQAAKPTPDGRAQDEGGRFQPCVHREEKERPGSVHEHTTHNEGYVRVEVWF